MRLKKFSFIGVIFLLAITFAIVVFDSQETFAQPPPPQCQSDTQCNPGQICVNGFCQTDLCSEDQIILRLSATTNAHGKVFSALGNYPVDICYGEIFGELGNGDRTCTGNNKVVGLSATTNAHAEAPDQSNYATNVCYGNLACVQRTGACQGDEKLVLSLSSPTNAHLAKDGFYSINVCCSATVIPPPTPSCEIESASWSVSQATEGQSVNLNVVGNLEVCDGETVSFEVFEDDLIGDDPVTTNPSSVTFSGTTATGTWVAEYQDDGAGGGDPEYYFKANIPSDEEVSEITSSDPLLSVRKVDPTYCNPVTICGDYYTSGSHGAEESCKADICNVSEFSVESINSDTSFCDDDDVSCFCEWNVTGSSCNTVWKATKVNLTHAECINNQCVEVPGDGINGCGVVGQSCTDLPPEWHPECVGLTCMAVEGPGAIECSNSAACKDEPIAHAKCQNNMCIIVPGDGINECGIVGQACDPPTDPWHPECVGLSCTAVSGSGTNECSGSLACSETENPTSGDSKIGKCVYQEETDDTCEDDGFLTFSWTAQWTWDPSNPEQNDPRGLALQCKPGQKTVECPAQIPLPFFGFYNLVIALLAIGAIYGFLNLRKRKI